MTVIKKENSQNKKIFGSFDFVVLFILLPFFLIVCNMDEMFYENVDNLRLASGAALLVYVIKKIFSFCIYSGGGTLANLIAAATSLFLSYLLMFPIAGIIHLQVANQLPEYLFSLLVLTYVLYHVLYREKLETDNNLSWKERFARLTKSLLKLLLGGVVVGVVILLILKLFVVFFSIINISVGTFFNLFGMFIIWMFFAMLFL